MKESFLRVTSIFVVVVAGWASTSFAQISGASIAGTVRDPSGAVVPGVRVEITNVDNGSRRSLTTDAEGRYSAPSLAVGRYELRATRGGFGAQVKSGVALELGQSIIIDFQLSVGEVRDVVTVEASPSPVSLSSAQSWGLIDERQVKELPLNGRSWDELMTLNAGVVNYTSERAGGIGTSNSSVGNMFAASGHRPQENIFLLNGIEFTGASNINVTPGGASGQLLGVDAVREFNVASDTCGAEFGKRPGAQVSIVTASGTNQLHGTVYDFERNSAFDARNFFDQAQIPRFQRHQYGAALGGPIKKDKLFLFGNYEGFRQNLGLSDVTLVPDDAVRAGYLPVVGGGSKYVGVAPGVAELLSLWPRANGPNLGGGIAEAFSHPLQRIGEDFGTARLDYNPRSQDSIAGVYTVDDSRANTPTVNPLSGVVESLREQVLSFEEQHVFSPALLNVTRLGFSRASYFFTGTTDSSVPGWITGRPIGAVVVGGGTASSGASQLSTAGTNAGSNLTMARNLFTWDDHVIYTHGRHQIKTGVWIQRIQSNDNIAQYQFGQASFGSLASLLQGTVSTFTVVPTPTELGWRSLEWAAYIEDTIRLRSNLELQAGFRFEGTNGWNESQGRASNYLFDSSGVIETNPRIGSSVFTVNRAKFLPEPRIGLAWDPFGKGKTAIKAGFGIYRTLFDSLGYRTDQTAPFNTTEVLKNAAVSTLRFTPGAPVSGASILPSGIQPDASTPTVISYSLKVEQEIASTALQIAYVGSRGYHEILSVDANEPVPAVCPAAPCPANLATGTIYYAPGSPLANPKVTNTTTWLSNGVSSYNALEIDVTRRLKNGLQIRGVYTWSKNLDEGTAWNSAVGANAPGFVMFPSDPRLDWGPATTDVRHLAVINASYELPFGHGKRFGSSLRGWTDRLAGGWSASGIETLHSGLPFTPQLGFNPTNNGDSRNPIRPSWNPAFRGRVIVGSSQQYFDPSAFILPPPGTYGNVRRDTLSGPGLAQLDLSLSKRTSITEAIALEFRAEAFNLLNRANFATPNTVVFSSASSTPSPTAGVITATATSSRQIQLGLKVIF